MGGGREALAEPGTTWGTTDPKIALELFEARQAELKEKRRGRVGVPHQQSTTLAKLVRHHLLMKEKTGRTSDSHLFDPDSRLRAAIEAARVLEERDRVNAHEGPIRSSPRSS